MKARTRRAFSLVELMTVVGIIALLISILLPALGRAREMGRRTVCLANLRSNAQGCIAYSASNDGHFPSWGQERAGYASIGEGWDWDGFSTTPTPPAQAIQLVSNTRNLWMLVRGQAGDPKTFICPSDDEAQGPFTPADMTGIYDVQNRSQFSYSFQYQGPRLDSLNSNATVPGWNTTMRDDNRMVVLADATPAMRAKNSVLTNPLVGALNSPNDHTFDLFSTATNTANAATLGAFKVALDNMFNPALGAIIYDVNTAKGTYKIPDGGTLQAINSANHRGEGQNVVRLDGSGEFAGNPWAGVHLDNIYTVQDSRHYADVAYTGANATGPNKSALLADRMVGMYEGSAGGYTENIVLQEWAKYNISKNRFPDTFLVP